MSGVYSYVHAETGSTNTGTITKIETNTAVQTDSGKLTYSSSGTYDTAPNGDSGVTYGPAVASPNQDWSANGDNTSDAQDGSVASDSGYASIQDNGSGSDQEDSVTGMVIAEADMDGSEEVPEVDTPATGKAVFFIDTVNKKIHYMISYSGLTGGKEVSAHIHGPAESGANADILFPLPLGEFKTGVVDYQPSQEADILAGKTYVNIHSEKFPDGEMRGQIIPVDDNSQDDNSQQDNSQE